MIMLDPKPASPRKNTLWIWVVAALVVLCLCCLVLVIAAGAFAFWKGYIPMPAINLPGNKIPAIPTPQTLPKGIPRVAPTKITVEPYQPQPGDNYPALQQLAPGWQDPTAPGSQTYDITVGAYQAVLLTSGWCTTTQTLLDQNYRHIKYLVEVNGQSVSTNSLTQGSQSAIGKTCKDFAGIIRAWPAGKHTLKISMRLDAKINDGWNDYPAGDYAETYNITIKP
jgi:hypothetical protein